jgi:hypothetical protein
VSCSWSCLFLHWSLLCLSLPSEEEWSSSFSCSLSVTIMQCNLHSTWV